MNKLKLILLLCVFCNKAFKAQAQTKGSPEYNVWNVSVGDTLKVYACMANVRVSASSNAVLSDSLPCGTSVVIKEKLNNEDRLKGIYAPWLKVNYFFGNKIKEGYMWMGLLAIGRAQKGNVSFVYGLEKIEADKKVSADDYQTLKWFVHVKALQDDQLLDDAVISFDNFGSFISSGKLLGDMGLKNTEDVLRIQFGGEACGIPTNYFYFGWTGNKFLNLPEKMEVGDAGVFYHTEVLLFPKEPGGQSDKIIRLVEEATNEDEKLDKNGDPILTVKKWRDVYIWDGEKAIGKRKQ